MLFRMGKDHLDHFCSAQIQCAVAVLLNYSCGYLLGGEWCSLLSLVACSEGTDLLWARRLQDPAALC